MELHIDIFELDNLKAYLQELSNAITLTLEINHQELTFFFNDKLDLSKFKQLINNAIFR